MTSRKGTLRDVGYIWNSTPCNPSDGWEANIGDRLYVLTWKFGSIHQCKVFVKYPGKFGDVGVCLEAQPTRKEAMLHGIEWAKNYIKDGPPGPEEVFKNCFDYYPDLFKYRSDVINQLFFVIGNGYVWCDGAIMSTSPEDYISSAKIKESDFSIKTNDLFREMIERDKKKPYLGEELVKDLRRILGEDVGDPKERPLPEKEGSRRFYPISKNYSNITKVPSDVRADWLAIAYEAAILLRNRAGVPEGSTASHRGTTLEKEIIEHSKYRELGAKIVEDLERRFPQLKA